MFNRKCVSSTPYAMLEFVSQRLCEQPLETVIGWPPESVLLKSSLIGYESLVTYHTSALHGGNYGVCIPGEIHSFGSLFCGACWIFSDYSQLSSSPVEPPLLLVTASGDRCVFVLLTNQSWTNQNQPLWARSWIRQQLGSSPTVVQHDFQEPDTSRCSDLAAAWFRRGRVIFGGPTQLGAPVAMT